MLGNSLRSLARAGRARLQLSHLAEAGGDAAKIAAAIRAVLGNDFLSFERAQIEKIEELRRRLYASEDDLALRDFGAPPLDFETPQAPGWVHHRKLGEFAARSSKQYRWALLLFKLVRSFKPKTGIELGACCGISACFQAAAMLINGKGRLSTFEGAPELAEVAIRNLDALRLEAEVVLGRFQDTLAKALERLGPVDYAFIDGHHDETATVEYFDAMYPSLAAWSLVVFDDIDWSPGMKRAWRAIDDDRRVSLSVDLGPVGICVVDKSSRQKERFRVHLGGLFG